MPVIDNSTIPDRERGERTNTHPRVNAELVLTPDDVLEGLGDFVESDEEGNPLGWRLGKPLIPTGWNAYVGTTPTTVWRQNASSLAKSRPSFVVNQPVAESQPAPSPATPLLASIPTPDTPRVFTTPADNAGYPQSTDASPYWFAWSYAVYASGNYYHSLLSDPASFSLEQGQSARVPLPDRTEGVRYIGLWLSEPGTSRPEAPGRMYLQRIIDLEAYFLSTYDLTGPFRYLRQAATRDEALLPTPSQPKLRNTKEHRHLRVGEWRVRVTFTNDRGESLASSYASISVSRVDSMSIKNDQGDYDAEAGKGKIEIKRPTPPPGATGWRAYVMILGAGVDWSRVYDRVNDLGNERPFPISKSSVVTAGWEGNDEHWGIGHQMILVSADLPTEDTTGLVPPDSAPQNILQIGAARPEPGTYYVRVTDDVDGVESLPSQAVVIDIGENDVINIVPADPENLIPNGNVTELGSDGLPLHHTITTTGGEAYVEDGTLVLETTGVQTGATPEFESEPVEVDTTLPHSLDVQFAIEDPSSGAPAGSIEIVLVEYDENNVATETVLTEESETGGYELEVSIEPALSGGLYGSGISSHRWGSGTKRASIKQRFKGASKNKKHRHHKHRMRKHRRHKRRRRRHNEHRPGVPVGGNTGGGGGGGTGGTSQPPIDPSPPPDDTILEGPPEPPLSPETYPFPGPDRPLSSGVIKEYLDYESAPTGWTSVTTGSATIARATGGAITGTQGMRAQKTSGGTLSSAYQWKNYAPEAGGFTRRYALGQATQNVFATWPADGSLKIHPLRGADGSLLGWFEASSQREVVDLTITAQPTEAGSVAVTLNGVTQNISVVAQPEIASLAISTAPTSGTVAITLDGVTQNIPTGGTREYVSVKVVNDPDRDGYIYLTVDGVTRSTKVYSSDSTSTVANRIKNIGWPGWSVSVSSSTVYFLANVGGDRSSFSFSGGSTAVTVSTTVITNGSSETASAFADRLRITTWAGWNTGGTGTTVTWTSKSIGDKTGTFAFSAGTSGASATMSTTQQGSQDTTDQLATRIRGTSFSGWSTSGTGSTVRFTSTASGLRTPANYDSFTTGAIGTMETINQGTQNDVVLKVQDPVSGEVQQHKVMTSLTSSSVFNLDITINGAGSNAGVVTAWGSIGSGVQMDHLARFSDIDLTNFEPVPATLGVFEESSASLTWDLHFDETRISDRGLNWYRDHNTKGQWINQVNGDYRPTQPVNQDLLLQDGLAPVMPGEEYLLSAFVKWLDASSDTPAKPIYITAYSSEGAATAIGDITDLLTGGGGVSGTSTDYAPADGWVEASFPVIIPANCYVLALASRDISSGQFRIQEVVVSGGEIAKRTGLYATSGSYRAVYDISTPRPMPRISLSRERKELYAEVTIPTGCTATVSFRGAQTEDDLADAPYVTDSTLLGQYQFLETLIDLTGTGVDTPVVHAGSPVAEYVLLSGQKNWIGTLLTSDRRELEGGASFSELEEWDESEATVVTPLPSGRTHLQTLPFGYVGAVDSSELQVFTPEAKRYLSRRWNREHFVLEAFGEFAEVKMTSRPRFQRTPGTRTRGALPGEAHALYVAQLPPMEVIEKGDLPQ